MSDSSRLPVRKNLMPVEDLNLNNEIFQGTRRLMQLLKRLWPEEEGQGLSEYALLLFLVSLTAVTAMGGLASRINTICSIASTHVSATTSSGSLTGGSAGYASSATTGDNSYTKGQSPKPAM
jgi:Flp pilus assembly pilin Flp